MSTLMRDNIDPNNPLYYAPPRLRRHPLESQPQPQPDEPDNPEGQQGAPVTNATEPAPVRRTARPEEPPRRQSRLFEDAVSRALQEQLEPEPIHAPSVLSRRASRYALWGVVARFALAAAAAAAIALFFVMVIPVSRSPVKPGEDGASMASTWQSLKASLFPAPQRKLASTLVVNDSNGAVNEPLQLGLSVSAPGPGSTVTLRGLPSGARITAGKRISASEWRVPAQEVSNAAVIPPTDFNGQITLAAELRGDDGDALVGGNVHLTWNAPAAAAPASMVVATVRPQQSLSTVTAPSTATPSTALAPPTATAPSPSPAAVRTLDPREAASFLNRAQDLISTGDLQSARLLLRRVAEAQNARAAFVLAQTYDPIVLKRYGTSAPAAEVNTARSWYERARDWGAPDAQRQLDALEAYAR
jgi:hypothetical protein